MPGKVNMLSPLYSEGYGDNLGHAQVDGPQSGKATKDPLDLNKASGVSRSAEVRAPIQSKD